ncbi:MAG: RhuM family protein, partial [Bacteroidales bacterium]
MENQIILYQAEDETTSLEVRVEDETVWLTQAQIVNLFASSKANVSEHIAHIFDTGELQKSSTVRKFRTVQNEGSRKVTRDLTHYNLDVIISIGYRVNSKRGVQFRIWANQVLKDYLLKGYAVNHRIDRLEDDMHTVKNKLHEIDFH